MTVYLTATDVGLLLKVVAVQMLEVLRSTLATIIDMKTTIITTEGTRK